MSLSEKELHHALEVGKEAATAAAALLRECYRLRAEMKEVEANHRSTTSSSSSSNGTYANGFDLAIEEKANENDLVTKYDKECEDTIIAILTKHTPSFKIISEERNPNAPLTDAPTWIIDPIDGTMDFVHGLMDCCVAIGLAVDAQPCLGIVYCPFVGPTAEGELIYGGKAVGGAWLNGKKVRHTPQVTDMSTTIVSYNMPWRQTPSAIEMSTNIRRDLLMEHRVRGIRAYGSAVFQEVQVALGRVGGYSEPGGKIWDVAAGAALIEATGGTVLSLEGGPFVLNNHMISCGVSAHVAETMASLCKKYDCAAQYWAE